MKRIRILAIVLIIALAPITLASGRAVAATDLFSGVCSKGGGNSAVCKDKNKPETISGTDGLLLKAARVISVIAAIAAVIVIIIGGFSYVTSNGDSQKVSGAKRTIIYAIVGLVVIAASRSIIEFIVLLAIK